MSVPFAAPSPASSDPSISEAGTRVSFVTEGLSAARFPWQEWKSEVARQWKRIGAYGSRGLEDSAGSLSLRKAIAGRLRRERGIPCDEEDIVVTSGSMQAIALLAQLLLEEGKTAVVENPCYKGIERAIRATGAGLISQRTDRSGIVPQDWEATLLFVTPTRQFPTGVVLGYERRQELLLWASKRKAFIIEDDYDSDFRWGGRPLEPLKALDKEGRVVYVGTFSRSMGTSLRIGFAVVPRELLQPLLLAKKLYDPYPTSLAEQQALAGWMSGGGYDRHMRKTRRLLGKLERKLRECLETSLAGLFTPFPADAGMHVYARWEGTEADYERLIREGAVQGVRWKNGSAYELPSAERPKTPLSAIFGFAHLTEREIEEGIRRIRRAAEALALHPDAYREQGGKVHA
jgi:GntR family transcriptional regulator/MocR family aminotransferase